MGLGKKENWLDILAGISQTLLSDGGCGMKEKIRECVEELFSNSENTVVTEETKEELILNLWEKYDDLLLEGMSEQAAFYKVVAGIGDVDELLKTMRPSLEAPTMQSGLRQEYNRQKRFYTMLRSIAICLYILIPLPILFSEFRGVPQEWGVIGLLVIVAVATLLIIYSTSRLRELPHLMADNERGGANGMADEKLTNSNLQDFALEMMEGPGDHKPKYKILQSSVQSLMWSVIVLLYFILSFMTSFAWTWILFIVGALLSQVLNMVVYYFRARESEAAGVTISRSKMRKKIRNMVTGCIWTGTVVIYLGTSLFGLLRWQWSWILFPLAFVITEIVRLVFNLMED